MKSFRRFVFVPVIAAALAVALSACGSQSYPFLGIDPLLRAVGASAEHEATFAEVYGEQLVFDRVIAVCPYDSPEDLNRVLGSDWSLADEVAPPVRESEGALVFADGSSARGVVAYSRASVDFCASDAADLQVFPATEPLRFELSDSGAWVLQP